MPLPDKFVKTEEEIMRQKEMHKSIANWYETHLRLPIFSKARKRLIIRSIMLSTPTARIIIGSGTNARPFHVFPSLLKLSSDFFSTYDFRSPARPPGAKTNAVAAPTAAPTDTKPAANGNGDCSTSVSFAELRATRRAQDAFIATKSEPSTAPAAATQLESIDLTGPEAVPTHMVFLQTIDPTEFACFLSWVYTGAISEESILESAYALKSRPPSLTTLWFLGTKLGSPAFQNRVMEALLQSDKVSQLTWPKIAEVREIEAMVNPRLEGKRCQLYDLAVLMVAIKQPLMFYKEGTKGLQMWEALLLGDQSRIMRQSLRENAEKWQEKSKPWHKPYRAMWLVNERLMEREYKRWVIRTGN